MNSKTILIIDDSLTVRQQVSVTLTTAGYQIVEARDGREGVDALRARAGIAMVLCDVNMPRMNGLEFLETVKGECAGLPVPVVMLTTDGAPDLIARAKRAGAKGWIVKPFRPDLLVAAVRRIAGEPT
jgi:two-component system, chemotaxis family, chemotaxis protein CheY